MDVFVGFWWWLGCDYCIVGYGNCDGDGVGLDCGVGDWFGFGIVVDSNCFVNFW